MSGFKSDQYGTCTLTVKHACPIELTMHIIGGKWKGIILSLLSQSPMYYNEMRREIPGITQRILTLQLRDLEKDGIVEREETNDNPKKVLYYLTALGEELVPILKSIEKWGNAYMSKQ
ncbi:winged helix-turn-helix transcriptional regulator [Priestia filamentosa]|uniref:HxlR family transcriptional regulator n=1 Tax=Priestia filamentosa TaxID=1402861 RepID=A0A1X7G1C2_9BACI|nr:helix-turn-helix domain-containing protein [Priestia filamentosa]AKO92162.1 HxlR family transcriptional regulator [Priestia filamentosa]MDT3762181.1 helix-turn-helix domain-containing protein [Priestia filamentosa]OXS65839.1 transcriptional regulator [Priestia filamentosa]RJS64546.1 transcriptional regulator [Priestia filamentosa]WCM17263.1 helix-turn-helix domain-containing protein [Priestia filamentosa]